jgi:N-acetylglucosamine-6-phosphate deacetylase
MKTETGLLKNARVITSQRVIENAAVLVDNGRIANIFETKNDTLKEVSYTYNLDSLTLYSGFIDIHIHGAVGVDTNDTDADGLHEVAKFLAKSGVTSWLPTLVPDSQENYQKSITAIDELTRTQDEREPAARVVGVHYEGPFVNEKQSGALRTRFFKTFVSGDEIKSLPRLQSPNAIHLTTLAPEIEGGVELVEELVKQNWIVSIGHTRAEVETLDKAFANGARHLTHFFNAMSGLHHRDVGVVGWGLTNDDVTFDLIADGIHVHPQMLKFACDTKTPDKVLLISDAVLPTGLGDGDFEVWGEKICVRHGKTENKRGSIAGSVITMLDAVRMMLSLGFSEIDIAKMASLNPARVLKIDKAYGSVVIGKRADLVAIDENGKARLTIIGGRVAHTDI